MDLIDTDDWYERTVGERDDIVNTVILQPTVNVADRSYPKEDCVVTAKDVDAIVAVVGEYRIASGDEVATAGSINVEAIVNVTYEGAVANGDSVVDTYRPRF